MKTTKGLSSDAFLTNMEPYSLHMLEHTNIKSEKLR